MSESVEKNFINADVFYSEPEAPTEEDESTGESPGPAEVAEVEPDEETTENKPRYVFDEEAGTYTFKANGQEQTANVDELVEYASKGYGFEKNNAKLNQREKERAEAHKQAVESIQTHTAEIVSMSDGLLEWIQEERQALKDQMDELDYSDYERRKDIIDAREKQILEAREKATEKATKINEAETKEYATKQWELLQDVMQWDTEDKMHEGFKEINDYAISIGMTAEDMNGIYNHKIYQALSDAAKYKALLDKSKDTVKEVKSAPKSVKSKKSEPAKQERTAAEVLYGS